MLINPPVSLYTSALTLDTMLADNLPVGLNNFQEFFDRSFHAFSEIYRDGAFGFVVDSAAQFFYLFTPIGRDTHTVGSSAYTLVNSTDTRHQVSFRYYETGSPFEYDLVRLLSTKKRQLEIAK